MYAFYIFRERRNSVKDFLILACVGALGGLITGLLGIGGGVLFILGLAIVFKEKGKKFNK